MKMFDKVTNPRVTSYMGKITCIIVLGNFCGGKLTLEAIIYSTPIIIFPKNVPGQFSIVIITTLLYFKYLLIIILILQVKLGRNSLQSGDNCY